jgi:hypothetical protein
METSMTNKELDEILGTSSKQFIKYRTITIDNGSDIVGKDATGNFIERVWNNEFGILERKKFSEQFNGVIIASKAKVVDKGKKPSWTSGEFDPSNKEELIPVYPLSDGKMIKQPDGRIKMGTMVYSEIKRTRSMKQPDGRTTATYNYLVILYVLVDKEIIKLQFKGTSRGNFFEYAKNISYLGAKIYNVMTNFSTYVDKETGKYAINFECEKDEKGNPIPVNEEKIRMARITVAEGMKKSVPALNSGSNNQLSLPEEEIPSSFPDESYGDTML